MNLDPTSVAYGVVGLAAGAGVHFWRRKAELEERCDFLIEMGDDLVQAFDSVDDILNDRHTPPPIREAILVLLAAHSDNNRGKKMALSFMETQKRGIEIPDDGDDPISQSMENLVKANPALARRTHHVLARLIFGLVFLNLADDIKVERVKDETAKDPATLWVRIARMFGNGNDHDHHEGGVIPV